MRNSLILLLASLPCFAQDLTETRYHLTARPWKPLKTSRDAYLDPIEGICRFTIRHQNAQGAVIDPFLGREHQYSTPYFAFAVGVLVHAGRALDLLPYGIRAMDHATECLAGGRKSIPDDHGEFFLAPLTGAIELYRGKAPAGIIEIWRERLRVPLAQVLGGGLNNWQTYPMKGEWMRVRAGLAPADAARAFIAQAWWENQRNRIVPDKWNLYHDRSSDPESHAVEAVGRGNLLALVNEGYDGPFAAEIRAAVERGTLTSLLFQDPSGQCPMNGRTDDHVFNDVLYQLAFEVMAERAVDQGKARLAAQYRRAALLSFQSIARWRRADPPWDGSFYITKNRFDPAERVGYQTASNYGNYNGAVMLHLAEAWLARRHEIAEQPAPVEIGGYSVTADWGFGSVFANAGGMQVAANLRGDATGRYEHYWTALGVSRMGRVGWDTRLGPSDGARDWTSKRGVSLGPTWKTAQGWVRLADLPATYRGAYDASFAHPLLVWFRLEYRTIDPNTGPRFQMEFTVTPDGVLITQTAYGTKESGLTLPLLENDGKPLQSAVSATIASTRYPGGSDAQNFISLHPETALDRTDAPVRSTYGWLRPVRLSPPGTVTRVFVYPRGAGDPSAEEVRRSLRLGTDGFSSILGRVEGNLYVGRTSAGGVGSSIDLDNDGKLDATFPSDCGFILQLDHGRVTAIEADRDITAVVQGRTLPLRAFEPQRVP